MKTALDCYVCFVRQTLDAALLAGCDELTTDRLVRDVLVLAAGFPREQQPVRMGQEIQRRVRAASGLADPYLELKRRSNAVALGLLPGLRQRLAQAADPFATALRLAIAGNVIDFGVPHHGGDHDLGRTIDAALTAPFGREELEALRQQASRARSILYVGDNAGECILDRLLVEQLPPGSVTYVVRAAPVLNDALQADAEAAGLPEVARLIDSGADAPGALLDQAGEEFRTLFRQADLVIAKGQGNYECLASSAREVYCLLKVKCPVIAADLGLPIGAMVAARA